jgi:enoyl-CoA hydratase
MSWQYFLVEQQGAITEITINRPDVHNAMAPAVTAEFMRVLDIVEADPSRVIILTGAGERAFSAGADIKALLAMSPEAARAELALGNALTRRLEQSAKVTIAAVNGYALGGGTEFALACDLRIASTRAVFGLPEVKLGIFPGWGGAQRLPRLIGRGRALELLTTGRSIAAAEALAIGLVNRVVEPAELLPEARRLAGEIIAAAPLAVAQVKRAVMHGLEMPLEAALAYSSEAWLTLIGTEDYREGMQAFLDKRQPVWKGR